MSLLSIIIVSYNTSDLTIQTLASVIADLKQSPKLSGQTEIILVDNDSSDSSVADIQKWHKTLSATESKRFTFELIKNPKNTGFAQANNLALSKAQGRYFFLLNSDTIVQPGALQSLVETFEEHAPDEITAHLGKLSSDTDRLGIVAASLFNPDQSPQPQGGSFPTLFSLANHMLMLDDIPVVGRFLPSTQHTGKRASHLSIQDWVGGTAMMIRRELIAEIGGLDQEIFMYGEDVEFCLRARNHHWDIAIQPQAKITHIGSASSTSERALKGEFYGYLHIWRKHKHVLQMPLLRLILKTGALLRSFLFGTMVHQPDKARVYRELWRENWN
jgi:N-acetylglucosaminyl-diphospho-decaprenol L-rhamnosyltransferase